MSSVLPFQCLYREYDYAIYEFMFELKIVYKQCCELYKGDMSKFYDMINSKSVDFIMTAYYIFISPISSFEGNRKIVQKYDQWQENNEHINNNADDDTISTETSIPIDNILNDFYYYIDISFVDIYELEYTYLCENTPSLFNGKFFLKNPQYNHKTLFYKKITPDNYMNLFLNTPAHRKMDLFANYA